MKRYLWLCISLTIALVWLGGAVELRVAQVKKGAVAISVRGTGESQDENG
jgi:hypothetical protein